MDSRKLYEIKVYMANKQGITRPYETIYNLTLSQVISITLILKRFRILYKETELDVAGRIVRTL